jgi:peroxiredoxin
MKLFLCVPLLFCEKLNERRTMVKRLWISLLTLLFTISVFAQAKLKEGIWRGELIRNDGYPVVFNFEVEKENGKKVLYVINADERLKVDEINFINDSVNFHMPVFESEFRLQFQPDGSLKGNWIKGTAAATQYWPFFAYPDQSWRFKPNYGKAKNNISGRWTVTITRPNNTTRPAVAEFVQKENQLTGTFLTPTGDYRYLDGIVTGDSLFLSTFDGAHSYAFSAKIENDTAISGGTFRAGIGGKETWIAKKDENAALPENLAPQLKEGHTKLDFTFKDIDGKNVSINDARFRNKVVIVQIMGSWCPNCMDETKFLSEYYSKNKHRGVEVVSLAYEYSTDFERSQKSLRRFQQRLNVTYPMLITGVTSSDTSKTEKTLPQISSIRAFPTTIFLDKKGNVREIHASFYGPGAGAYHEQFKKEFNERMEKLIAE